MILFLLSKIFEIYLNYNVMFIMPLISNLWR